jgi:hypothetical protein
LFDDDASSDAETREYQSLLEAASERLSATSARRITIRLYVRIDGAVALSVVEDADSPLLIGGER